MRQFTKISMLTLLTASLMFAQGRGPKAGNAGWWMDELDLTAKQKATITNMQTDFQKSQIKTRSNLAAAEVDLRALSQDMDGNAKQIKAKQAEINQIRTQLQNASVDHRIAIRKVLTPEQQVLFDKRAGNGMREGDGFRRGDGRRGGSPGQRGIHTPGTGGGRR
ncbi:MAG: Spy/CpxP family protein refolding chaperone [Candidatus Marinimicrobia bacterium]|nr:Spy/CpxP family protein refolding chaperone [Candidatus Neomarinimicrobiota bacterium]MCF7839645.1 Spy/CpxP family protein refolding chaperone [Candidatus Neomarinimicrobiota bacterium]MCF7902531.1 Spy/CpxP family protein refolding chaperone [Candidatus Neomarinimicrobiota bacterium]